mmetsp:Transcript_12521/g.34511  ORF Transcript_12521/g.34511 Transcript_12521/m.34511 type:complete len:292 (-) Transcript_12521:202-1077(-)
MRRGGPVIILGDDLVGDEGKAEDPHAAVMRSDDLWDGAHADAIPASGAQEVAFRFALVHGPGHEAVGAVRDDKVRLHALGRLQHGLTQLRVVRVAGGWKSRSQLVIVGSHQRILAGQVRQSQMVRDADDVSDVEGGVETAGGVGDDDRLDIETSHDVHGQHHRLHVMSLVGVEPSAEAHGRHSTEQTKDDLALVPRHGAMCWEARNLGVLDGESLAVQGRRQTGESGTADDADAGNLDACIFQPLQQVAPCHTVGQVRAVEDRSVVCVAAHLLLLSYNIVCTSIDLLLFFY